MSNIKNYRLTALLLLCLFPFVVATQALAQEFSKDYIVEYAKQFVKNQLPTPELGHLEIQASSIDPRIKIKPCPAQLKANIPENNNSRNVIVKIYCEDSTPWQLFIPTKVRTMVPVAVTNAAISKHTILDHANIKIVYQDSNRIHGSTINDLSELIGTKAKRNLSLGAKLSNRNVCFVCKGDDVTIIARSDNFMIKTDGTALQDGAIGDKVPVKNKRSNKTVTAQVKAINQVVINL